MKTARNRPSIWRAALVIVVIGFCLPLGTAARDDCGGLADRIQHGGILWTEGAIVVQGTAAPNLSNPNMPLSAIKRMTQSAATLDAYRKAAAVLSGVRISSRALAADNPQVITRIESYVRGAKVCKAKYYADGGVDMVVAVPLNGAFAMDQIPDAGTAVAGGASSYSGLVVDARHLAFAPAIAPRLLGPEGNVLFSAASVRKEVIMARGAARFVARPEDLPAGLVGDQALTLQAYGLGSQSPSDLVLDADGARALAGGPSFLGEGKVAIIYGESAGIDCGDLTDQVKNRFVDWENKMVYARGYGKVDFSKDQDVSVRMRLMERAAEVDAQRKLLETFLAVRLDGRRDLKALPNVAERAQGLIMNAARCGAKYYRDGSAEVVMAAPLDAMAAVSVDLGTPEPQARAVRRSLHSGLVVDATGLAFEPVLAPEIQSQSGQSLFGPDTVAQAYAQQHGVVGYSDSLREALVDPRIGAKPLKVKALGTGRQEPGKLTVASSSASSLKEGLADYLQQGRVIIVTEKAAGLKPRAASASRSAATAAAAPAKASPPPKMATSGGSSVREGKLDIP